MLPEHLVSSHFHLSSPPSEAIENSKNLPQGKTKLSDYEPDILISANSAGNPKTYYLKNATVILKNVCIVWLKLKRLPV